MDARTYMLEVVPTRGSVQRHLRWIVDAWRSCGGRVRPRSKLPSALRRLGGRLLGRTTGIRRGRLLVPAAFRVETAAWPFCCFNEIVPVMWDVWPGYVEPLVRFAKRNRVKLMFVTASRQARRLRELLPEVRVEWMPEAIDVASYPSGGPLAGRPYDVIEYGRRRLDVHADLTSHAFGRKFELLCSKERIMCPKFDDMTAAIRSAKISICYPKVDTSPEAAGDVETLTQRYWEAMSSGTLVVGRAPQELIDVCGYNPVVTLGERPAAQVEQVLNDIDRGKYQDLADRNRAFVERHADWQVRVRELMTVLEGMP